MLHLTYLLLAVVAVAWLITIIRSAAGKQVAHSLAGWTRIELLAAASVALGGLALRLIDLGHSLDLDEFGTLWAVESDFSTTVRRSIDFHGQSPVYYLLAWASLKVLGESESAIRLPSLVAPALAALVIYRIGLLIEGRRAGLLAASVFWLSPAAISIGTVARPYGLAFLFTAIVLYGFIRAVNDGRAASRICFVAGGVGLIASHYLWGLTLLGVGAAYLITPELRRKYAWGNFSFDVIAMAVLGSPLISQVLALWGRRSDLLWVSVTNYFDVLVTFLPTATLVAGGLAAGASGTGGRILEAPSTC
jgi:mannosyltransferase